MTNTVRMQIVEIKQIQRGIYLSGSDAGVKYQPKSVDKPINIQKNPKPKIPFTLHTDFAAGSSFFHSVFSSIELPNI